MKLIHKRSEELQQTILGSPALLKELSEKVAEVLDDRIKLPENATYVFVPRVYSQPTFWPEVYATASVREYIPFGGAGPLDPQIAHKLNEGRITYQAVKDSNPLPARPSLRMDILRSPELFLQLSETLAGVLAEHGVTFGKEETFAFVPVVVKKPLFAGQLAAATPFPLPSPAAVIVAAAHRMWEHYHFEEFEFEFDPGVIIDGIPAPEILLALEQQRIA